jgi:hypothetical protein
VKSLIDLLSTPGEVHRVLRHLETRGRDATRVRGLAWREEDLGVERETDPLGGCGHVGPFGDADAAVLDQRPRLLAV